MSHTARRRLTGSVVAGLMVVALFVYLASLGVPGNPVVSAARADEPEQIELSDSEAAANLLARLDLSPAALAAVGASPAQATAIVLAAHATLLGDPDGIVDADVTLGEARADVARLLTLVQAGQATQEQVSELAAARAAVTSAESAVALAVGVARAQVLNGLSEGQRQALDLIRANRAMYGDAMPVAVAADAWTDATWIESRAALCSVAQAESYGVEPDSGAADVAVATMDRAYVAAAEANLQANLADVTGAWEAALAGL